MNRKKVAQMLAIAFGLLMAIPTIGMLTAQATTPSEIVLVDSSQLKDIQNLGGNILVNYNNGRYLVSLPSSAITTASAMGMHLNMMSEHRELNLYPSQYRFNPAKGVPQLASNLMKTYKAGEMGEYIVQFIGPVKSEWISKVSNAGAVVERDVAKYGIVVKMTPETAATVRALPEVAWVGVYEPAYKIPGNVDINSDKTSLISLRLYKGVDPQEVASKLSSQGITVISVQKRNVIISIQNDKLPEIAQMPEVSFMGTYSIPKPLDYMADRVIHLREVWYPLYNGLNDRFIGWGQVVGIQDTGFDEGDDTAGPNDLFQGPLGDRVLRFTDEAGGSVPDGANGEKVAHGTHSCGLIAGNGWSWEKQYGYPTDDYNWDNAQPVGAAPGAKLSIDGIEAQGGGLSPSTNYWDTEQNDGAQIYSNGWGGAPGDYDSTYSTTVDNDTSSDNRRLFIFSAGNYGPQRDTLNPDSQGKDGICVAASRNFRPDWFDADDPNTIADFSSKGGTLSDTRIKPDLAAPGTAAISLLASGQYQHNPEDPNYVKGVDQYNWTAETPGSDGAPDYQYMEGSSVATAIASGSAAVIRQYLVNTSYSNDPTAQIIKALMINGARRLPNIHYPGYDQGWGLIDIKNSLMPDPPTVLQYTEATMSSTGTWDAASDGGMALDVRSDRVPLKVTLVWIDTSGVDLNRDLDLYVEAPDGTWYHGNAYGTDGWTMPDTTVANSADTWLGSWDRGDGYDGVNNVEQVEVEKPMTGTWTVHVIGYNVPSATPFALVVRADIGSKTPAYSVGMKLGGNPILRVDQGGSVTMPVTITNYGTSDDTIQVSDNIPSGLTTSYTYGGNSQTSFDVKAGESKTFVMTITANASLSPGTYPFTLSAISSNGNSRSSIYMRVDVVKQSEKVPYMVQVTNDSADEVEPSICTFTDSDGTNWIFVAYMKAYPVSSNGKFGGYAVMVEYSQLGSDGMPTGWHGPIRLTTLNEHPNDIRILNADGGEYRDRVWVIWTGDDPNATHDYGLSKGSWGRIAWADHSDYSSWTCPATGTNTTIDENTGNQTYNMKRINSIQYRAEANELVYVFDHVDYDSSGGFQDIHVDATVSTDGGSTWETPVQVDPGDKYYFFPETAIDANDVVWLYYYQRSSTGNNRDLSCMVYDGSWKGDSSGSGPTSSTDVYDTADNVTFPVVAYDKSAGSSTNRVWFAALRDGSGTYQIYVGHHDGAVSSSNPPPDTTDAWGSATGPMGLSVSNSKYYRRPVLNMVSTSDGYMWIQYLERSTPYGYGVVNVRAYYSNDSFATSNYYMITTDSYGKGHQMSSSVDIGDTGYVYTIYHMTKGEFENTDYNIYLGVYHKGLENSMDTQAPEVLREIATPAVYNSTDNTYEINLNANPSFDITATGDDSDTGRSTISSAYWMESDTSVTDPTTLDWSSATQMDLTGSTVIEKASDIISPSWANNTVHRIWIKVTDSSGNSGYSYIDLKVVAVPPSGLTVNFADGWNLVSLPWLTSLTDIGTALNGISWTRAMVYQNGVWHTYDANRDAKFNVGFPTVDNTVGIWVYTSSGSLSHADPGITSTNITLSVGWNLVGYPSDHDQKVSDALAGVPWQYLETTDANGNLYYLSSSDYMTAGKAYWIYVNTSCVWTVNW